MNFLLAVGITSYLITQGLEEPAPRVKVKAVLPNTPAEMAGIKAGDSITSIEYRKEDGRVGSIPTRLPSELVLGTREHKGEEITLVVLRQEKELKFPITPRTEYPANEGAMGINIDFDIQTLKYPWYEAPYHAFTLTVKRGRDMIIGLASLPAKALTGQKVSDEVAGPLGIAQVTGEAKRIGFTAVLNLMSILSLSLALLNVLPIPALDGGRLFFIIIETIMGKPVHPSWERSAHQLGMIILLLFIALVTLNDISRIVSG